jgi:hypothetical protein
MSLAASMPIQAGPIAGGVDSTLYDFLYFPVETEYPRCG